MLQYKGHVSQSGEDNITKIDTLEGHIGSQLAKLVESMDLPPSKEIDGEENGVTTMQIEHQWDIFEGDQRNATMNEGEPSHDGKEDSGKDNSDCPSKELLWK